MFESARLKLTGWYILIIMCISLLFSGAIYFRLANEIDRVAAIQRSRAIFFNPSVAVQGVNLDVFRELKTRALINLLFVNSGIFVISGLASYFLAGRTLGPIEAMVEEQKRFTSDASHELRTPLTALKTEIEVGLRDNSLTLTEAKTLLKSNLEEVNKLRSLAEGLLAWESNQHSNNQGRKGSHSVKDLIDQSIQKVESIAKEKDIHFKLKVSESTIEADSSKLVQLFVIILDNAIKYSPKNSIITITDRIEQGKIQLIFRDKGVGIDPADLPHVFDRFYRADTARSNGSINGHGLGLSIAKQIVEQAHGEIEITSRPAEGTTVTITLPQHGS